MKTSSKKNTKQKTRECPVIDAHCDSLLAVMGKGSIPGEEAGRNFLQLNEKGHSDLPRLLQGGVICQFMALFTDDMYVDCSKKHTHSMIDAFYSICHMSNGMMFPLLTPRDLTKAQKGTTVSALLSIEGAEALEGSLDSVDEFYDRGVRAIGITWNRKNPFARGVRAEGLDGFSSLGKELIEKMEHMGMIIDASHLSDQAFWDLSSVATRPFVASHSNSRTIQDHLRNLTDEQIRRIADGGGVIGAVFVPAFLSSNKDASLTESLIQHIDHIVDVGGIDVMGLGSDFDGYNDTGYIPALRSPAEFPLLAKALLDKGYAEASVEKIFYKNWKRLIEEVLHE
jgi:membrane dipeptidase